MLSLLPILMMQAGAPAPLPADMADARCIFVIGYVGAPGTPQQIEQAKRNTMYFVGKLRGRNAATDLGKLFSVARDDVKRSGISAPAEAARCAREIHVASGDFASGVAATKVTP